MIALPTNLESLIDYASGATVSKTLVKNGGGSITLFAFDAGQSLSEHTAPFDAVVLVIAGSVVLTIGGKPHTLSAGQMILMPANIPHGLRAESPVKMLLTMLKNDAGR